MSENENIKTEDLSSYIADITDQELKVLLLKLKNEIYKPDVGWEDIKPILKKLKEKDINMLKEIMPMLLND